MTSFGEAVGLFYRNYVNFEGRASRSEHWWPFLMQFIVYIALFVALAFVIGGNLNEDTGEFTPAAMGLLMAVFTIANGIIGLTWFAQMIWYMVRGTNGPNKYGPDPLMNNADIFG